MRLWVGLCTLLTVAACSGDDGNQRSEAYGGTLVISVTADPGTLFPPFTYRIEGKQITEQLYDYLADVGPELNTRSDKGFRPQLAESWRWSPDSLSIAFHLNPRARWHDGQPVTTKDVKYTFALNKNPALGGGALTELTNIDSVSSPDSVTAIFWFRKRSPTQFLDAAAQMLILPAHLLEKIPVAQLRQSSPVPVGSGRFRLRRWVKGASVEIVADSGNYRGRARLDRVIWSVAADYKTAVTRLVAGDADLFDALTPEDVKEAGRHKNLRVVTLIGTDYNFLQFNLRDPKRRDLSHPLFGNRELRRAIAMSVDRTALVKSVLDTLGLVALGPTTRAYATTDPRIPQVPFDPVRAGRILDSLGWLRSRPGEVRRSGGRALEFALLVLASSKNRMKMAVLLQAELARQGIRVKLETLESGAFYARQSARNFDALLGSLHLGASPDGTRDAWTAFGARKNGANYGSYIDPLFDAQLDKALSADPAHARDLFTAAYGTINADAPAVWLYEPKTVIGIDRRFRTTWMRSDAWWSDVADWSVSPSGRIPRDAIPPQR